MQRVVALAIILSLTSLISLGQTPQVSKEVQQIAADNNEFAYELYDELKGAEGNLFFSPFSISSALAMTYAGARNNTESQMAATLHFAVDQATFHKDFQAYLENLETANGKGLTIRYANRLWGQEGIAFEKLFSKTCKTHYKSGFTALNFSASEAARKTINTWVEEQTEELIKDLIPKGVINSGTKLVLTNAIYFKGDWVSQFNEKLTKDRPFHTSDTTHVEVPFMWNKANYGYAENAQCQVLDLPYQGGRMSMVMLLPKPNTSLKELEKQDASVFNSWINSATLGGQQTVAVTIPKFKFSQSFSLADQLKSMGMEDAFGGGADFSGMTGGKGLYISDVIHKAFIDVNEEGTEAAAATAVVVGRTSAPQATSFFANRPFFFAIRDNATGSILFMGRVCNPSAD